MRAEGLFKKKRLVVEQPFPQPARSLRCNVVLDRLYQFKSDQNIDLVAGADPSQTAQAAQPTSRMVFNVNDLPPEPASFNLCPRD